MPTGYTFAVQEGTITELRDYALEAVKAFLPEYRDHNGPIRVTVEPDSYHYARVKEYEARLTELLQDGEATRARYDEYFNEESWTEKYNRDKIVHRERYEAMLEQVKSWQVSPSLDGLKAFMIKQLEESIAFDCCGSIAEVEVKKSFESWYLDEFKYTEKEIAYHKEEYEKDCERANQRNAWVAEFLDNLPKE